MIIAESSIAFDHPLPDVVVDVGTDPESETDLESGTDPVSVSEGSLDE
jgi:hypothetical protein